MKVIELLFLMIITLYHNHINWNSYKYMNIKIKNMN